MEKFKAILVLCLGLVPVLAAVGVLIGNVGNTWDLHLIFGEVTVSRSLILLLAPLVGLAVWRLGWAFIPRGSRMFRQAARHDSAAKAPEGPADPPSDAPN